MIVNLWALFLATTFLPSSLTNALSPSEVPSDTPISTLLASANAHLAKGDTNDALTYYDIAIQRDPKNYLTYFKRGATYLSLGRTVQATQDFDKVLLIKPGFDGALLQRAKIRARNGDWNAAREDYRAHGHSGEELADLEEAEGAAALAFDAGKAGNWEECVSHASVAIRVAGRSLPLRQTRARCRFEKGEVQEGMSDLKHVLNIQSSLIEPHIQISAITFYALADSERGLEQLRKCLHSDPDSKPCKTMYRREKQLLKQLTQVKKHVDKKQYTIAVKLLLPSGDDVGLLREAKNEVEELKAISTIPKNAPNDLVAQLVEMVCEAYHEMNNYKKARPYCSEALTMNEYSLHGLLSQAQSQMEAESYEAAISTLNTAKEHHPGAQQIQQLLQTAHVELKRSKTKDYYKVLNLPRDADELQIKAAYRRLIKLHHPDKSHKLGISKEDAEKKMAQVNEAYEVLSDPELKERFDRGDDPNDHESQRAHQFHGNPFGQGNPFAGGFPGGSPFGQQGGGGGQQFNFKFAGGGFNFG